MENTYKTEPANGKMPISDISMNDMTNENASVMNDPYAVSTNGNSFASYSSLQQSYSLQNGSIGIAWDPCTSNSSYVAFSKEFCCNMLSYTNLNGKEEIINIDNSNIISITRHTYSDLVFTWHFPFIKIEKTTYSLLSYLRNSNDIRYVKMLESPSLIAKKLGIECTKTSPQDLVDDDLAGN